MKTGSRKLWGFLAVAGLAFLVHLPAVRGDFHFDDFHHIVDNPAVKNFPGALYFFTHPESFSRFGKFTLYRPITLLSFALNDKLAGAQASGWLVFNVLIHSLNAGLVFLLFGRWLPKFRPAFLGGLIFAFLAMLVQPVNYLSDRATLLSGGFVILALILDAGGGRQGLWRPLLAAACFWLGLLSKETAAVFPALVIVADWFLLRRKLDRSRVLAYALYGLNLGLFLLLRFRLFHTLGSNFHPRTLAENAGIQVQAVFFYLVRILFPIHLSILPDLAPSRPKMLAAVCALILLSAAALIFYRRARVWSFGWFWFLLGLLPSSVIALNVLVSEERVYLSSVAAALLLAAWFERALEARAGPAYVGTAAVLLCQVTLLEFRSPAFHSEFSLWRDAIKKSPYLSETYNMYGGTFVHERDFGRALKYYELGLHYYSEDPQIYAGLCAIYLRGQQTEEVLRLAQRYLEVSKHPWQQADALGYQAQAESLRGNFAEAEKLARAALEKNSMQDRALYVLARASLERGDLGQAEEYGRQALAANPDMVEAHGLLGFVLLKTGRIDEAVYHFEKYVELSPDQAAGWLNLSVAYGQKPDLKQARAAVERALKLKPDYALGYNQMAVIEWESANPKQAIADAQKALELDPDLLTGHQMLAGFWLTLVELREYDGAGEKKELLGKVREQMAWLKARGVDTKPLEDRLKKLR